MQIGMSARNRCIRWRALAPPGAIATECSVRGGDATLCQITLDTCYQARRQETKRQGVFFVKKWTFPQRRVHCVQYQYF